jgi:hypothetical protein
VTSLLKTQMISNLLYNTLRNYLKTGIYKPGVVVHAYNPSTWEAWGTYTVSPVSKKKTNENQA